MTRVYEITEKKLHYHLGKEVPAKTYANAYHGGSNIAYFLDLGNDNVFFQYHNKSP